MPFPRRLSPADLLGIRSGSAPNKDARMTNCMIETNSGRLEIIKRPGYTTTTGTGTGAGYGAITFSDASGNDAILQIQGNSAYTLRGAPISSWTSYGDQTNKFGTATWSPIITLQYNGVLFGILGWDGTNYNGNTYMSDDGGKNWTFLSTDATLAGYTGVAAVGAVGNNKMWIAASGGYVFSSTDGVTWTATGTTGLPSQIQAYFFIGTDQYVLAPSSNVLKVYKSTDNGANWADQGNAGQGDLLGFGFVQSGSTFYTIGGRSHTGTYSNAIWSSTNGTSWSNLGNAAFSVRALAGCCINNSLVFVAGGVTTAAAEVKDIWVSYNMTSWTQVSSDTSPASILKGNLANVNTSTAAGQGCNSRLIAYRGTLIRIPILNASVSTATNPKYLYRNDASGNAGGSGGTSSAITYIQTATGAMPSGTMFASASPLDFSQNLLRTIIAMKNGNFAWIYTISTGVFTQVTDADYPATTVRGIVYLDGTFYVMDKNGVIYGSGTNDFTSWSATNVINAQCEPDGAVCLTKYGQYVVAFGNYTTEFFYDAGNATGSPLSPVQNSQLMIGCANGDTVAQQEGTVYFCSQAKVQGQSAGRGISVSVIEGMASKTISTPDIERILNVDGLSGAWGLTCSFFGHDCYVLNLPTTLVTLAYDIAASRANGQPVWFYLTRRTTGSTYSVGSLLAAAQYPGSTIGTAYATANGNDFADGDVVTVAGANQSAYNVTANVTVTSSGSSFTYPIASVPVTGTGTITAVGTTSSYFPMLMAFQYLNIQVFQDRISGQILQFDDTLYTDAGVYIDYKIRTSNLERGGGDSAANEPKFLPWVDIITDRSANSMLMRYTDDDFQTYSYYRKASLATARSRLTRLGSFFRRAFEFRHTDSAAVRFQGLDIPIEQGSE